MYLLLKITILPAKEKHISIYVNEHETAQKLNEKKAEVHLVK